MCILTGDKMVDVKIDNLLEKIFNGYDLNVLSNYEKRRIIFNYLSNNLSYDKNLLEQIKNKTAARSAFNEIMSVLDNKIGICNGIAQVYMLLLKKVGIKSVCICCDDSTEVSHQLNLVKGENGFSFDDVTNGILKSNKEDYFDYDLDAAHAFEQGNRTMFDDSYWFMITYEYVCCAAKKEYKNNDDVDSEFYDYVESLNSKKFSR